MLLTIVSINSVSFWNSSIMFSEGYMHIQFLQFVQTHLQVFNDNDIRHKIQHVLFSTSKWHFDQISKVWYAWPEYIT
jgi:hypothetical protein